MNLPRTTGELLLLLSYARFFKMKRSGRRVIFLSRYSCRSQGKNCRSTERVNVSLISRGAGSRENGTFGKNRKALLIGCNTSLPLTSYCAFRHRDYRGEENSTGGFFFAVLGQYRWYHRHYQILSDRFSMVRVW